MTKIEIKFIKTWLIERESVSDNIIDFLNYTFMENISFVESGIETLFGLGKPNYVWLVMNLEHQIITLDSEVPEHIVISCIPVTYLKNKLNVNDFSDAIRNIEEILEKQERLIANKGVESDTLLKQDVNENISPISTKPVIELPKAKEKADELEAIVKPKIIAKPNVCVKPKIVRMKLNIKNNIVKIMKPEELVIQKKVSIKKVEPEIEEKSEKISKIVEARKKIKEVVNSIKEKVKKVVEIGTKKIKTSTRKVVENVQPITRKVKDNISGLKKKDNVIKVIDSKKKVEVKNTGLDIEISKKKTLEEPVKVISIIEKKRLEKSKKEESKKDVVSLQTNTILVEKEAGLEERNKSDSIELLEEEPKQEGLENIIIEEIPVVEEIAEEEPVVEQEEISQIEIKPLLTSTQIDTLKKKKDAAVEKMTMLDNNLEKTKITKNVVVTEKKETSPVKKIILSMGTIEETVQEEIEVDKVQEKHDVILESKSVFYRNPYMEDFSIASSSSSYSGIALQDRNIESSILEPSNVIRVNSLEPSDVIGINSDVVQNVFNQNMLQNKSFSYIVYAPDNSILYDMTIDVEQEMTVTSFLLNTGLPINNEMGFVSSLNGINNSDTHAWMYEVNGKTLMISADQYIIQPGDVITWKYIDFTKDFTPKDNDMSMEQPQPVKDKKILLKKEMKMAG